MDEQTARRRLGPTSGSWWARCGPGRGAIRTAPGTPMPIQAGAIRAIRPPWSSHPRS
jgi:hypothetical protein